MLQLIVLDMAGTTVYDDQDVSKSLQKALAETGTAIPLEDADALMGIPKPVAIRQLLEKYHADKTLITEALIDRTHDFFVKNIIHHYETHPNIREKEGVSEIFALLKKNGVKIAIDTGFDRPTADAVFKRLCWVERHLIDVSITSDEVANGRPFPDMIFKAMQLTGIEDVKHVAKVGDTASDMQQGTSAGCGWVIGVTTGAYSAEDLRKFPHTHLIKHISELKTIFNLE
ncbi:MAG: HAD-IA family hydrolase [Verrucomicrobia bacterium]|nr:HAD-IA family hydrolase [Cytophagales bacterium]